MDEPNLKEGFSYRSDQCMFEGEQNWLLDFQFEEVAVRLSGDLVWDIKIVDPEAAEIVRGQTKIMDAWITERKRRSDEAFALATENRQTMLAAAIKGEA